MSTGGPLKNGISKRGLKQEAAVLGREEDATSSSSHWTLLVLFLSLLVDLIGFTVILPLIPSILEYYSKNDQVSSYWYVTLEQLCMMFRMINVVG